MYENRQYKQGLKSAETILKKFPEHGGMSLFIFPLSFLFHFKCVFGDLMHLCPPQKPLP